MAGGVAAPGSALSLATSEYLLTKFAYTNAGPNRAADEESLGARKEILEEEVMGLSPNYCLGERGLIRDERLDNGKGLMEEGEFLLVTTPRATGEGEPSP